MIIAGRAASTESPFKKPELTITPVAMSVNASLPVYGTRSSPAFAKASAGKPFPVSTAIALAAAVPDFATTWYIGRPNTLAKSKSRSSCAGTAMIAPVP